MQTAYFRTSLLSFSLQLFLLVIFSPSIFSQNSASKPTDPPQPRLVEHSTGPATSEMKSLFIDVLRNKISNSPNSRGVIFLYCSKDCQIGEIEAHLRGLYVAFSGKGVNDLQLKYMAAGYREKFETEYWLIPGGASFPEPVSTLKIAEVALTKRFKGKIDAYDCCD